MADPTDATHTACDQRITDDGQRIAELEADVTRLREALEAVHLVSQAEPTAHLLSIEAIARHALREGEPHG